jgi:hypothetical protein
VGPHRFTQKRPRTFVSGLQILAAVETSKNRLLRDFRSRSIFDFCNTIESEADLFFTGFFRRGYCPALHEVDPRNFAAPPAYPPFAAVGFHRAGFLRASASGPVHENRTKTGKIRELAAESPKPRQDRKRCSCQLKGRSPRRKRLRSPNGLPGVARRDKRLVKAGELVRPISV